MDRRAAAAEDSGDHQGRVVPVHDHTSLWLRHGLRTLASHGPGALKVGPMSETLNVTRGSFYWHFRDIEDFRAQLLLAWQEIATDQIIDELDSKPGDADRLKDLLHRAFSRPRKLDRAVRSWAAQDKAAARRVAAVDARRIARVARLLVEAGVDDARAASRHVPPLGLSRPIRDHGPAPRFHSGRRVERHRWSARRAIS